MPRKRHESGTKKLREALRRERKAAKLAKRRLRRVSATVHMTDNRGS